MTSHTSQPDITVELVSGRRALTEFINLPSRIYHGLPGYVAPLTLERRYLLDPRDSAFFAKGRASYWLARRGNRPVGRISAQVHPDIPLGLPAATGMFGCLDTEDDATAVRALLGKAEEWLAAQGCTYAFGPCLLSMNGEPGLMIDGHDKPPMTLVPWHPAYLQRLIEEQGFAKYRDLQNWRLELSQLKNHGYRRRVSRDGLGPAARVRHLDKSHLQRDLQVICDVYNAAWCQNDLFTPLSPLDFRGLEKQLKPLLPAEACTIVEIDGEPAGVVALIPNMFEITGDLGAEPGPTGWLRLGLRALRHRFRSGRIILMGVSPQFRNSLRGFAIAITLVEELLKNQEAHNGREVEAGWVLEDNQPLISLLKQFGFSASKTFRLYLKKL